MSRSIADQTRLARAVFRRHRKKLLARENVVGVGVGFRERASEVEPEICIAIDVRKKEANPVDPLPPEVEGVPIDVGEAASLSLSSATNTSGATIKAEGRTERGRLGLVFESDRGCAGLTVMHVLAPDHVRRSYDESSGIIVEERLDSGTKRLGPVIHGRFDHYSDFAVFIHPEGRPEMPGKTYSYPPPSRVDRALRERSLNATLIVSDAPRWPKGRVSRFPYDLTARTDQSSSTIFRSLAKLDFGEGAGIRKGWSGSPIVDEAYAPFGLLSFASLDGRFGFCWPRVWQIAKSLGLRPVEE